MSFKHVSASGLGSFLICPLHYKHQYVWKTPGDFKVNAYIVYGSAIHSAIEFNYRQKITSRSDLAVRDVQQVFTDKFLSGLKAE